MIQITTRQRNQYYCWFDRKIHGDNDASTAPNHRSAYTWSTSIGFVPSKSVRGLRLWEASFVSKCLLGVFTFWYRAVFRRHAVLYAETHMNRTHQPEIVSLIPKRVSPLRIFDAVFSQPISIR